MSHRLNRHSYLALLTLAGLILLLSACVPVASQSNASPSVVVASLTARSQSFTTACPTAGTVRPAIMPPITLGQHANLLYIYDQGTYPNISKSMIRRYDIVTGSKTDILSLDNATIGPVQLSADGQWVLFVTQVGGEDSLQLVRVDGQFRQTLFCLDPTKSIYDIVWSPDQKRVLVNLVHAATNSQPPMPLEIGMLNIGSGQFQAVLDQPENVTPVSWLDNTRVLLEGDAITLGGRAYSPLLLDLSRGLPQQASTLRTLVPEYLCGDYDPGTDGNSVLIAQCTEKIQGVETGPSTLTLQPIAGGAARTILTDKTMSFMGVRPISSTTLVLLVQNQDDDTSKNGLWKVNVDGTHLTRLFAATQQNTLEQLDDPGSIWSTASRDGRMYSLLQEDATTQPGKTTLFFGSLNGGAPTAFASLFYNQGSLSIVGWTTM